VNDTYNYEVLLIKTGILSIVDSFKVILEDEPKDLSQLEINNLMSSKTRMLTILNIKIYLQLLQLVINYKNSSVMKIYMQVELQKSIFKTKPESWFGQLF